MATRNNPTTRRRNSSGTSADGALAADSRSKLRDKVLQQNRMDTYEDRKAINPSLSTLGESAGRRVTTEQNSRNSRSPNRSSNPGRLSTPTRDSKPRGSKPTKRGGR